MVLCLVYRCMCVHVYLCIIFANCYSPLHIAAKSGLVGVVKELINRGADLNIRDADGMSHNILVKYRLTL